MSGQRKAVSGCAEGKGSKTLQVLGALSCFSHRGKNRLKESLDEIRDKPRVRLALTQGTGKRLCKGQVRLRGWLRAQQ